jgi:hypothetical protein
MRLWLKYYIAYIGFTLRANVGGPMTRLEYRKDLRILANEGIIDEVTFVDLFHDIFRVPLYDAD